MAVSQLSGSSERVVPSRCGLHGEAEDTPVDGTQVTDLGELLTGEDDLSVFDGGVLDMGVRGGHVLLVPMHLDQPRTCLGLVETSSTMPGVAATTGVPQAASNFVSDWARRRGLPLGDGVTPVLSAAVGGGLVAHGERGSRRERQRATSDWVT